MTPRPLNRTSNPAPAHAMKTYGLAIPRDPSYWRSVSCAEAGCRAHANGWVTRLDESIHAHAQAANDVRTLRRGEFTETKEADLTVFTFGPGHTCFASNSHRVRSDRPPLYLVKGGDHRGNPRHVRTIVHKNGDNWVDDFAGHQDRVATLRERG